MRIVSKIAAVSVVLLSFALLGCDPGLSEAGKRYNAGLMFQGEGEPAAAIAEYDKVINVMTGPATPVPRQDFNFDLGLDAREPRLADAYNNRGSAYGKLGQYQRQIQDSDEAIRLDPGLALAYSNRGFAFDNLGQHQRAIQDLDEAIRLDSNLALAYYYRGNVYSILEEYERAILDYDDAIRLDLRDARNYYNRGPIFDSRSVKYQRQIQDLDDAASAAPEIALAYQYRGVAHYALGSYELAALDLERAIRREPGNPNAYRARALAYGQLGRDTEAQKDVSRAVDLGLDRATLESLIQEIERQP